MQENTLLAIIWAASAIAISVGVIITGSATPLWALFVPLFVTSEMSG